MSHFVFRPLGSMHCIVKKYLLPGEGTLQAYGKKPVDITSVNVQPGDREVGTEIIAISALHRIYYTLASL